METENLSLGNWRHSPPPPPIQLNTSSVSVTERSKGSWLRATQVPPTKVPPPHPTSLPDTAQHFLCFCDGKVKGKLTQSNTGTQVLPAKVPLPLPDTAQHFLCFCDGKVRGKLTQSTPQGCGGRKPELGNKGNPPHPPFPQQLNTSSIFVMESSEGSRPRGPPPSQTHQPLHRQKMGKNFACGTCELKQWRTVGRVVCRNRTSIHCLRLFMSVPCKTEVFQLVTFFLEVLLLHVCCAPPPLTHYFLNAYFYPSAVMSMLFLRRAC